jgi:hypothetical protein
LIQEIAAEHRQSVQRAWTTKTWTSTSTRPVSASTASTPPKPITSHGIVRQRSEPPSAAKAASARYAIASSVASGMGKAREIADVRTASLLAGPNKGSQTHEVTCHW